MRRGSLGESEGKEADLPAKSNLKGVFGCSSRLNMRLRNRVDLEPQSDLEVSVRSIWRLSDRELLCSCTGPIAPLPTSLILRPI